MTPDSLLSRKGGTSSKRDEYFGITNLVEHPAQLSPPGTAAVWVDFAVKRDTTYSEQPGTCKPSLVALSPASPVPARRRNCAKTNLKALQTKLKLGGGLCPVC